MPVPPIIYASGVVLEGAAAYGLRQREFRVVKKAAYYAAGKVYRDVIIPRHFGEQAAGRYGYQQRSKAYRRYKRIKRGHGRPLEFSGRGKQDAMTNVRLIATSNKLTVRIKAPVFNYRRSANAPNMREELQTVVNEDIGDMNRAFREGFRKVVQTVARRHKVRYRLRAG